MYKMAIVLIFIYCHCENGSMYYYKALKYCLLIYFGDRKIDLRKKKSIKGVSEREHLHIIPGMSVSDLYVRHTKHTTDPFMPSWGFA